MKKLLSLVVMAMLVVSVMPVVLGVDVGTGIGIVIEPEEFPPHIWMCNDRAVLDDTVEPGRETFAGDYLKERAHNYAFEGEQIQWTVLVMDKNKIEEIDDVVGTIGDVQGEGNDIEVECVRVSGPSKIPAECNARILEEDLTGDTVNPNTQAFYECTFTVETPDSMYGEYWITVEAIGDDGQSATIDENEFWFLNPVIALSVDGTLEFESVRPGSLAYSSSLLVGNDADEGSGVLLDMFISGTDFYDSSSSDARCPVSNRLKLGNEFVSSANNGEAKTPGDHKCNIDLGASESGDHICYYATQGAYSTSQDPRSDAEGYVPIVYGDQFTNDFQNDAEIIAPTNAPGTGKLSIGGVDYYAGNVLSPGSEIALTFKLGLPEPCVGNFDTGDIFFWGEAI